MEKILPFSKVLVLTKFKLEIVRRQKFLKMNTLRASKKVKLSPKISMQEIQHRKIKTMK